MQSTMVSINSVVPEEIDVNHLVELVFRGALFQFKVEKLYLYLDEKPQINLFFKF